MDDNQLTIEPAVGYSGRFLVQVVASDGLAETTTSFLVMVTENATPMANDDYYRIPVHATLCVNTNELLFNDYDPNNDSITLISVNATAETEGTVVLVDEVITFTPNPDFIGLTTFEYVITDSFGKQSGGTVHVEVLSKETLTLSLDLEEVNESGQYVLGSLGSFDGPVMDDLVVTLESGSPDDLTLPSTVTIRAGQSTAAFIATIVDDSVPESTEHVTISATAAGWSGAIVSLTIQDNDGPILGDLNSDGWVNSRDLDIIRAWCGHTVPPGSLTQGDPSGDGLVNSADLDIIRANWGIGTLAAADASSDQESDGEYRNRETPSSEVSQKQRSAQTDAVLENWDPTEAAWAQAIAGLKANNPPKVKMVKRRSAVDLLFAGIVK